MWRRPGDACPGRVSSARAFSGSSSFLAYDFGLGVVLFVIRAHLLVSDFAGDLHGFGADTSLLTIPMSGRLRACARPPGAPRRHSSGTTSVLGVVLFCPMLARLVLTFARDLCASAAEAFRGRVGVESTSLPSASVYGVVVCAVCGVVVACTAGWGLANGQRQCAARAKVDDVAAPERCHTRVPACAACPADAVVILALLLAVAVSTLSLSA